jgi:enoyl-CoA hydratase
VNTQHIRYAVANRIARITLATPHNRNALSLAMRAELVQALKRAERDDEVSVVLIDADGPVFCSGYDLVAGGNAPDGGWISERYFDGWSDQFARHAIRDWLTIWDLMKPVVCKVHGACLAGGTELMSMCDIVFAADDARIGYPAVRAQASPDTAFFPWKMTMAQAKYMQLTGNSISGQQAARWGWIAKSFPAQELDQQVENEIIALASIAPDLLAVNKGCINETYENLGFKNALNAGVHWHMLSLQRVRPSAGEFRRRVSEDGMKAALRWRDQPFDAVDLQRPRS